MNRTSITPKLLIHISGECLESRGYSLVLAIGTIVVLSTLLASYSVVSKFESLTASSSEQSGAGFYAAEAGLNLRAEVVRDIFEDFDIPSGTSEDISVVSLPCLNGVGGTDDYSCINYQFQEFTTQTGLAFDGLSNIVIPPGEPFQFLNAQEFRYLASSISYRNGDFNRPQAILGMNFLNRSVPIFQFMAFFDKDLEITPGSAMTLNGPIHANGNIFLNAQGGSSNPLTINDRISVGEFPGGTQGNIYRVAKHDSTLGTCTANSVLVQDNNGALANLPCGTTPVAITADLDQRIATGFPRLEVPDNGDFSAGPAGQYWSSAELRVALNLAGTPSVEVRTVNNTLDATDTILFSSGGACAGTFDGSTSFYNAREADFIQMLEVDINLLMDCIDTNSGALGFGLDDETQGGLVIYLTVDGPLSNAVNPYGVRLRNGSDLRAANVEGLTIISDQAVYIQGDYNTVGWVPASVIGDSLNVLSNAWSDFRNDGDGVDYGIATSGGGDDDDDDDDGGGGGTASVYACSGLTNANCLPAERLATDTTIFAAFLAGTSSTGGSEGGFNTSDYNGGMHNYPRLHEIWTSRIDAINQYNNSFSGSLSTAGVPDDQTLTLVTSFISLKQPDHVDGLWQQGDSDEAMWWYQQPIRNFSFDDRFKDPNQLPPMTPQVTYLQQELFVRDFNR
ncbi:MAG: hypothetical protein AAF974_05850 [Cyanobacteria bacterium P01_E01_bin.34]